MTTEHLTILVPLLPPGVMLVAWLLSMVHLSKPMQDRRDRTAQEKALRNAYAAELRRAEELRANYAGYKQYMKKELNRIIGT